MSFFVDRLRGMQDILPPVGVLYDNVERIMRECASSYGFSFIRTPILEFTELFDRSVGDSSDIVQKEMYTFRDKSDRSVTMRPEFTAAVLRAVVGEYSNCALFPLKLMYYGPCYRYEKPQVGRFREFYQFGLEIFGANSFLADLDLIFVANRIFNLLKIRDFHLEINYIGCENCNHSYVSAIKNFFKDNIDYLCDTCKKRFNTNPLRILDCKNDSCKKICLNAPHTIDFMCENCLGNFENFKKSLEICNIPYIVNTRIVRGLDYYTKLVFEFVVNIDGDDLTICGGGRYDGLSKSLGGPDMSATGLAIGVERIVKLIQDQKVNLQSNCKNDIYIAYLDDRSRNVSIEIVNKLRTLGICADYDIVGRGLKSQLRYADKVGYKFISVLGSNEIESKIMKVKRLSDGSIKEFEIGNIGDNFVEYIKTSHFN